MTLNGSRIAPCLWFASEAEQAAKFYTSIFPNSSLGRTTRFGSEGQDIHGQPEGSVMTVDFVLDGHPFTALNGGPHLTFNEAVSFQVICASQEEVDHYWDRLGDGGDPNAQQCGWLKDRFGVSWQVVPVQVQELLSAPDRAGAGRAMEALMRMKKIDIAVLEGAYEGVATSHTGAQR